MRDYKKGINMTVDYLKLKPLCAVKMVLVFVVSGSVFLKKIENLHISIEM